MVNHRKEDNNPVCGKSYRFILFSVLKSVCRMHDNCFNPETLLYVHFFRRLGNVIEFLMETHLLQPESDPKPVGIYQDVQEIQKGMHQVSKVGKRCSQEGSGTIKAFK